LSGLAIGTGCDTTFKVYVEEGGEVQATWDGTTCTFWHEDGETKDDCDDDSAVFTFGDEVGTFEAIPDEDAGYSFSTWEGCDDDESIPSVDFTLNDAICTATSAGSSVYGDERTLHIGSANGEDNAWIVARFDWLTVTSDDLEPDYL
jgi:hypothetical protein